jgi:cell division control protein 6
MRAEDLLMHGETLFRNEAVFTPGHVPEDFTHRDSQLEELKIALKPGLRALTPINLLLHGPPGTGKTTAIKFMFNQISEVSNKLITIYINCEDFSTPYSIFAKIYEEIYGMSAPSTGKPLEAIKERVFYQLNKLGKSIAIALDELDRLFLEKCVDRVLIDLLKAHSTYGYDKVGIIGIMIKDDFMAELDEKARSVYNPTKVFFQPYGKKEIYDILANRVKYGFYDGVISSIVLSNIVEKTYERGSDLRIGIDLLRRSGLIAEQESSKKIAQRHVDKAYGKLEDVKREELEKELSSDEKKLLEIIQKSKRNPSSGSIYKIFNKETKIGIKKYNELISSLEYKNLIKTEYKKGVRERSRDIILI